MHMILRGALVSFALLGAAPAFAGTACNLLSPDVTNRVQVNIGCEVLEGVGNDQPPSVVDGMFGYDWDRIAKTDIIPGSDGPLTIGGDEITGTWSIAQSVFDMYKHVMLMFKGGNVAEPGSLIGYLVNTTSGTFDTPFFMPPRLGEGEISHVSLYVSGMNVPEIPLPAAGFLMLGAIGGLAAIRRRRKLN